MAQSKLSRVTNSLVILWFWTGYIKSWSFYLSIFRVRKSWSPILKATINFMFLFRVKLYCISDFPMYPIPQISNNTFNWKFGLYMNSGYLFGFRVFILFYCLLNLVEIKFFFAFGIAAIWLNHWDSIYVFRISINNFDFPELRE